MSNLAIRTEDLSKLYRIGPQERYKALRDVIAEAFTAPIRLFRHQPSASSRSYTIWALKGVSLEVEQGEVVGIIGRNGAGKSTLLKILSRITKPTEGLAEVHGRVGSLLEVGTGFHPELTGRENIYLNGAILGMRRAEIERKFDEIVSFAEVERFLDTPVKHYSSGMYVRLAFAVAAHMDPEILLVDEVLAVGDAAFQQKCLGKMEDVARGGRTVLFVSHNMGAILQLCSRAVLLTQGRIEVEGYPQDVISQYLDGGPRGSNAFVATRGLHKDMHIAQVQVLNMEREPMSTFRHDEHIVIAVSCQIREWIPNTVMGFFVRDQKGRRIFTNDNPEWVNLRQQTGRVDATVTLPAGLLVPGRYTFTFAITVPHVATIDLLEDILPVTIVDAGSAFSSWVGYDYGCVFADCQWSIESPERSGP